MVILLLGSEQIISMILKETKAKIGVNINKDKSKGMMDKSGQKFGWGKYPSNYRKEETLGKI